MLHCASILTIPMSSILCIPVLVLTPFYEVNKMISTDFYQKLDLISLDEWKLNQLNI